MGKAAVVVFVHGHPFYSIYGVEKKFLISPIHPFGLKEKILFSAKI